MYVPIEFPLCIAFGAVGGPEWKTVIAENQGGFEKTNQIWVFNRHSYDVSTAARDLNKYQSLIAHFNEVRGRANYFPFQDFLDFEVSTGQGMVSYVSPGISQIGKLYGSTNPYLRKITRPRGNLKFFRSGVEMTPGGSAGQYSIDVETGVLTVQPDEIRTVTSHTPGTQHVFVMSTAFAVAPELGSEIYLSGVAGSASQKLNSTPLTVVAVSGQTITVAVNTTGLTASGGNAFKRASPYELTWTGEFVVPVRYQSDQLPGQVVNKGDGGLFVQASSIILREVRE